MATALSPINEHLHPRTETTSGREVSKFFDRSGRQVSHSGQGVTRDQVKATKARAILEKRKGISLDLDLEADPDIDSRPRGGSGGTEAMSVVKASPMTNGATNVVLDGDTSTIDGEQNSHVYSGAARARAEGWKSKSVAGVSRTCRASMIVNVVGCLAAVVGTVAL
ncbi:hypothetical protein BGW38_005675 [Lunasporangiospora selenospora]|uniref:Uncharacterized protein n=1 Tax=Lunasporangiospora selenospora TaxID=979761 RepID=A0A9P6G2N4_9FUNG|nr:hypothetical protein BGW38_005675 [Lunasporangiospora selenospora]